jgi:hypothetical protein
MQYNEAQAEGYQDRFFEAAGENLEAILEEYEAEVLDLLEQKGYTITALERERPTSEQTEPDSDQQVKARKEEAGIRELEELEQQA